MTVKTAISVDDALFAKVEELAAELSLSRSGFIALAVREFVERYENQRLLEAINAAHDDKSDISEIDLLAQQRSKQRQLVEGQW